MIKKFLIFGVLICLSNCGAPGTALLGPSITGARTGSVYQASLSYGSSQIIKKTKEKIEDTKILLYQKVDQLNQKANKFNKVVSKNQAELFFKAVKDNLNKYN
ncbi:hypothetical protein OAN68_00195 [Candidatus Pelagibacter sp.]|nr:hypothetical protein [Candidatus Pelagibacter sp.]